MYSDRHGYASSKNISHFLGYCHGVAVVQTQPSIRWISGGTQETSIAKLLEDLQNQSSKFKVQSSILFFCQIPNSKSIVASQFCNAINERRDLPTPIISLLNFITRLSISKCKVIAQWLSVLQPSLAPVAVNHHIL